MLDDMERNIDACQILRDQANGMSVPMSSFYSPATVTKGKGEAEEVEEGEEEEAATASALDNAMTNFSKRKDLVEQCMRSLCSCAVQKVESHENQSSNWSTNRRSSLRDNVLFWNELYRNVKCVRSALEDGLRKCAGRVVSLRPLRTPSKLGVEENFMRSLDRWDSREASQIEVLSCMLRNGAWEALRASSQAEPPVAAERKIKEVGNVGEVGEEVETLGPPSLDVLMTAVLASAREAFNGSSGVFDVGVEEAGMMLELLPDLEERGEEEGEEGEGEREEVMLASEIRMELRLLEAASIVRDFGCSTIVPLELRLSTTKTTLLRRMLKSSQSLQGDLSERLLRFASLLDIASSKAKSIVYTGEISKSARDGQLVNALEGCWKLLLKEDVEKEEEKKEEEQSDVAGREMWSLCSEVVGLTLDKWKKEGGSRGGSRGGGSRERKKEETFVRNIVAHGLAHGPSDMLDFFVVHNQSPWTILPPIRKEKKETEEEVQMLSDWTSEKISLSTECLLSVPGATTSSLLYHWRRLESRGNVRPRASLFRRDSAILQQQDVPLPVDEMLAMMDKQVDLDLAVVHALDVPLVGDMSLEMMLKRTTERVLLDLEEEEEEQEDDLDEGEESPLPELEDVVSLIYLQRAARYLFDDVIDVQKCLSMGSRQLLSVCTSRLSGGGDEERMVVEEDEEEEKRRRKECARCLCEWSTVLLEKRRQDDVVEEIERLLPSESERIDVLKFRGGGSGGGSARNGSAVLQYDPEYVASVLKTLASTSPDGLLLAHTLVVRPGLQLNPSMLDAIHVRAYVDGVMLHVPRQGSLERLLLLEDGVSMFVDNLVEPSLACALNLSEVVARINRLLTSPLSSLEESVVGVKFLMRRLRLNVSIALRAKETFDNDDATTNAGLDVTRCVWVRSNDRVVEEDGGEEEEKKEEEKKEKEKEEEKKEERKRRLQTLVRHCCASPSLALSVVEMLEQRVQGGHYTTFDLSVSSISDMCGHFLSFLLRSVGTNALSQCESLTKKMSVKHLVLLAKKFVYPPEVGGSPSLPHSSPLSPPLSPLSLYQRKSLVEAISSIITKSDEEDKRLVGRASKQLGAWQCYLRAVEELEGSVASGEYDEFSSLVHSMTIVLQRYSLQPRDAKSCFIEMAGRGFPASLLARIVMTHKKLPHDDPRADKLLVLLYDEAFDLLLVGFQADMLPASSETQDDKRNWPPSTPSKARDAAILALHGLRSEQDVRNVRMQEKLLQKIQDSINTDVSTAGKSALLQVLAAAQGDEEKRGGGGGGGGEGDEGENEEAGEAGEAGEREEGRESIVSSSSSIHDETAVRRGSEESVSRDDRSSSVESSGSHSHPGQRLSSMSSMSNVSNVSETSNYSSSGFSSFASSSSLLSHIDSMLDECSSKESLLSLVSILSGKDVSSVDDVATSFGLWVNQDAAAACESMSVDGSGHSKEENHEEEKIKKIILSSHQQKKKQEMSSRWKRVLMLSCDADAPWVPCLLRGPCHDMLSEEETLELLDHMEVCQERTTTTSRRRKARNLLLLALSSSHLQVRRDRGMKYMREWREEEDDEEEEEENKGVEEDDEEDEDDMDELTSALVCRWPFGASSEEGLDPSVDVIRIVYKRIILGMTTKKEKKKKEEKKKEKGETKISGLGSGGSVATPRKDVLSAMPRRMSMRRISSPALVRRRLDTMEEEMLHLSSSSSSSLASPLRLPPPTTCTLKFFVVILILRGVDWRASNLLFAFYHVNAAMRTYDGGVAVLEHYMRSSNDDEEDGRDSTLLLGRLRRRALQMLE